MSYSHCEETLRTSCEHHRMCATSYVYRKVTLRTPPWHLAITTWHLGLLRAIATCLQCPQDNSTMILQGPCKLRMKEKNRANLTALDVIVAPYNVWKSHGCCKVTLRCSLIWLNDNRRGILIRCINVNIALVTNQRSPPNQNIYFTQQT